MKELGPTRSILRAAAFALAVLALAVLAAPAFAAPDGRATNQVLVRFRAGSSPAVRGALHAAAGAAAVDAFETVEGLQLIELAPGKSVARALHEYGRSSDVLYAEPNRRLTLQAMPDDPSFAAGLMWNLNMVPLLADTDVDGPEAWDFVTGSPNVVVTIIDTGMDYDHVDLAANAYRNEAECDGDGVDDDGNGWVDDCHGIDPLSGDSDPMDEEYHGTHVAGTIGAVGHNGVGVVGMAWNVKLMPCKVFDGEGYGTIAAAITCLDYVAMMKDRGVNIVATNNSWSETYFSAALRDAIDAQRQHGVLFIAAAGNYSSCNDPYDCRLDTDNDRKPTWPASYYLPNVLAVANSVEWGFLNAGSAHGRRTVHLAAPGTWILSTTPNDTYDYFSGTSMATPLVSGVAALLKAQSPGRDWRAIKNLILAGTEGDMFPDDGELITDARLNAHGSVACANETLTSRLRPVQDSVTAVVGQPLSLSALNIRCAVPNGNVTVTVDPGGQSTTLRDDGAGFDQQAGDGIYSGQWTPAGQGNFSLTFPGPDVVGVNVLGGTYGAAVVPFAGRTITGTPIQVLPLEAAALESPFPLRFGGGTFDTVFVDARGALQFDGGGYYSDLSPYNEPLPSPFHSTLIAPYWDQIVETWYADIVYEITGTAPNRELVVEWREMPRSDRFCALFEGYVTFQVVFFEGSSDVLFNYPDTTVGGECPDLDFGGSATVGIQVTPDTATQIGFNAQIIPDETSLLWTLGGGPGPQPAISVTPASVDFGTVQVGSSADLSFVVKNTGTGTLTGQASTPAPFSIVSGGAYSLTANQTQTVTVRFSPTAATSFNGNVTFSGGGGASRPVAGIGSQVGPDPDPDPDPDPEPEPEPACGAITGPRLKVTKLTTPGEMTLGLQGSFVLAPDDVAGFDPLADGIRLVIEDAGAPVLDLDLPGGFYDVWTRRGWIPNGTGTTLTYRDSSGVPAGGITFFQVRKSTQTSGLVTIKVKGKHGSYDVTPAVAAKIVLDGGSCFVGKFPGPTPACSYKGNGTKLKCD